jgi:hypothetical protein
LVRVPQVELEVPVPLAALAVTTVALWREVPLAPLAVAQTAVQTLVGLSESDRVTCLHHDAYVNGISNRKVW